MKLWALILLTTTVAKAMPLDGQQMAALKLENLLNEIEPAEFGSARLPECAEASPSQCDAPVHVSPWCKKQYDILKAKKNTVPGFTEYKGPEVTFLAEEHGDEQAYNFYEKLMASKKYDCLFLELPSVLQKNFDHRKGIIHEGAEFENVQRRPEEGDIKGIELKSLDYIDQLTSLVEKAKENDVEVVLVDSSKKETFNKEINQSIAQRNQDMASNILESFKNKTCSKGLSIQGSQHLFGRDETAKVEPIDEILKRKAKGEIKVNKAMVYSPSSKSFKEAMGPCSWTNILPEKEELYFSSKFYEEQNTFPERIEKSMREGNMEPVNQADYAIFLPLTLSSELISKRLNSGKVPPKRSKYKKEFVHRVDDIELELRANSYSLGVSSGEGSPVFKCIDFCHEKGRWSESIVREVETLPPTIECVSIHPSRANGHSYVPKYRSSFKITVDCYCGKKR